MVKCSPQDADLFGGFLGEPVGSVTFRTGPFQFGLGLPALLFAAEELGPNLVERPRCGSTGNRSVTFGSQGLDVAPELFHHGQQDQGELMGAGALAIQFGGPFQGAYEPALRGKVLPLHSHQFRCDLRRCSSCRESAGRLMTLRAACRRGSTAAQRQGARLAQQLVPPVGVRGADVGDRLDELVV